MRYHLIVPMLLVGSATSAPAQVRAQVSLGVRLPGVSIGINQPVYPQLVPVPGYPVYYAPRSDSNYFFYDGMYWVYQRDDWYESSWYNGPWERIAREAVPLFVLRVPVRYYRRPPAYFGGWQRDAPPRWGEHWGHDWEERRDGWDKWDHHSVPAPGRLPIYQRRYSGDRYPEEGEQHEIHEQNDRDQPRDFGERERSQQRGRDGRRSEPRRGRGKEHQDNGHRDKGESNRGHGKDRDEHED